MSSPAKKRYEADRKKQRAMIREIKKSGERVKERREELSSKIVDRGLKKSLALALSAWFR